VLALLLLLLLLLGARYADVDGVGPHCECTIPIQGGHKVGEKKFPEFSRLFQSHKLTFS